MGKTGPGRWPAESVDWVGLGQDSSSTPPLPLLSSQPLLCSKPCPTAQLLCPVRSLDPHGKALPHHGHPQPGKFPKHRASVCLNQVGEQYTGREKPGCVPYQGQECHPRGLAFMPMCYAVLITPQGNMKTAVDKKPVSRPVSTDRRLLSSQTEPRWEPWSLVMD